MEARTREQLRKAAADLAKIAYAYSSILRANDSTLEYELTEALKSKVDDAKSILNLLYGGFING